jgi:hypothetical protein
MSKTHKLAQKLECSVPTAVGYVHLLWHYTLKVSWQFGDLSQHLPFAVARGCWYGGEPKDLVDAFMECGFIDSDMKVHDWTLYAKEIIRQRLYNSCRKDKKVTRVSTRVDTRVLNGSTKPNLTKPIINTPSGFDFDSLWTLYPKKMGRADALKHFKAQVKTEKEYQDIQSALKKYIEYVERERTEFKFILHGSTWFNKRWVDWITYSEQQSSTLPRV